MVIRSRWTAPIPRCSLPQWIFGSACEDVGDKKIYMDPERPETHFLSRHHYRLLAKRVALGLLDEGLEAGDRVLVFSGNSLFFPVCFMGIIMAGGIFTGANPSFVARELAYQLRDSGASFLLVAEAALETALDAAEQVGLPRHRIFVLGGDEPPPRMAESVRPGPGEAARVQGTRHWTELLKDNLARARNWIWTEPSEPEKTTCCLNYSSGTTGVPKGVEISHYSYVANGVGNETVMGLDEGFAERSRSFRFMCFLP